MPKRKRKHANNYPNFIGQHRELHSCLRNKDGFIVRPIKNFNGVGAIRYELLNIKDIPDIKPNKFGRRALNVKALNDSSHEVLDSDWKGPLYKYCTHCDNQELLSLDMFTSNNHGYKSCLLTEQDAKRYHLKGYSSQPFCMDCKKKYVNSTGNKKRTREQFVESSALSRYRTFMPEDLKDKKFNLQKVFDKFEHKCFKCNKELCIENRKTYQIDHTLPASLFWNMDDNNCTLLCDDCNQAKSDQWPSMFYTESKLKEISKLTGIELSTLKNQPHINPAYIEFCKHDDFSQHLDDFYQGRKGRRKNKATIKLNCDHTVKKLIDKISKFSHNIEDRRQIFLNLSRNENTKLLVKEINNGLF